MNTIKLATENRKGAAQRLAEITGTQLHYTGVPKFTYEVGPYTIERGGVVSFADGADLQPLRVLAAEGILEPFEEELNTQPDQEAADDSAQEEGLTVSMPKDGFTESAIENLKKLLEAKGRLIQKAVAADCLDIQVTDNAVSFPWWSNTPEAADIQAYLSLISALCTMAKDAKRVTAKETDIESEKYAFRCFLLRLGFVGSECKAQRRLLMRRLSGSSAFRNKEESDKFLANQKAKREAAKAAAATSSEVTVCS